MPEIKKKLLQYCFTYADERIKNAKDAILSARDASFNDTKSSAGDKYETTREMMQSEVSRHEKQLVEAQKLKHALSAVNPDFTPANLQHGSLAITNQGNFFISVSAGQIILNNTLYFAISPVSPIGAKLIGLKKGDSFQFNGKSFIILDVC